MTNLYSILQYRDITLPTKVHLVKAMVFHVVMYRCESWSVKKAECRRIDAFELWCWRRLLSKEIQPVHSEGGQSWVFFGRKDAKAETPVLWPPDAKIWLIWISRPWCWERLKAGGEGANRGWDGWIASPTRWTWVWVNSGSQWWTGKPGVLRFMRLQRVGHDWATELNWTERLMKLNIFPSTHLSFCISSVWRCPFTHFLIGSFLTREFWQHFPQSNKR